MPGSSNSPEAPLRWRHWLLVAEAAALLLAARLLIAFVPFEKWRGSLGVIVDQPTGTQRPGAIARPFATALRRACERLPLSFKCLPQAVALQWMLQRRRIRSALTIAALPRAGRSDLQSLHAWVSAGGEILVGASELPYIPLLHLETG